MHWVDKNMHAQSSHIHMHWVGWMTQGSWSPAVPGHRCLPQMLMSLAMLMSLPPSQMLPTAPLALAHLISTASGEATWHTRHACILCIYLRGRCNAAWGVSSLSLCIHVPRLMLWGRPLEVRLGCLGGKLKSSKVCRSLSLFWRWARHEHLNPPIDWTGRFCLDGYSENLRKTNKTHINTLSYETHT